LGWYESDLWPGRYPSEQFKVEQDVFSATLIPFSASSLSGLEGDIGSRVLLLNTDTP